MAKVIATTTLFLEPRA